MGVSRGMRTDPSESKMPRERSGATVRACRRFSVLGDARSGIIDEFPLASANGLERGNFEEKTP
jgi:hypothetical protein